jgi:hypothetical protein
VIFLKRTVALILFAFVLFSFAACNNITEEVFEKEGFSITLTSEYREREFENYFVGYDSKNVLVTVIKEPFSALEGFEDYPLAQYADLMKQNCTKDNVTPSEITEADGVTYFEYSFFNKEGASYKYLTAMYKGDDAFWTVQFATAISDYEGFKIQLLEFAKSVDVTK